MPHPKQWLFILLTSLLSLPVYAQNDLRHCLAQQIKAGPQDQLDTLTETLLQGMPRGRFYLVGESHTFLANNDLQVALIKKLHTRGVYNVVNELPHAACFLFNEYLETGDDSLLARLLPATSYRVLKEVRAFNASLPAHQQVRYYGIDYIDPDWDFTNLASSLRIIRHKIPDQGTAVDKLIAGYCAVPKHTAAEVTLFNKDLASALITDSSNYQKQFGRYYHDLLLMAHNIVEYKANRDKGVYTAFRILYSNLLQQGHHQPGFLAFYGMGHMNNLGGMLQDDQDSPVQKAVIRIGLQYFQCPGGWSSLPERIMDNGIAYKFPQKDIAILRSLFFDHNWTIGVMPGIHCLKPQRKKNDLDGLVIFKEYGTRRMRSWKFD